MQIEGRVLYVAEPYCKFFVCTACGESCYFVVTNDTPSLPKPMSCPYNIQGKENYVSSLKPKWKEYNSKNISKPK